MQICIKSVTFPFSDNALSSKESEDPINITVNKTIETKKVNHDFSFSNLQLKDSELNAEEVALMSPPESKIQQ